MFIESIIPIKSVSSGTYTACLLVFYLTIPFLGILLQNITRKQHKRLIVLLLFLYVFLGTVPGFSVTMNYVSWFAALYFIAAYIRLYPAQKKYNYGLLTLLIALLMMASVIVCLLIGKGAYSFVTDSNTFLAFAFGVCSFMYFKNLKLKNNYIINSVAGSTFGVLCIHANSDAMRAWLWGEVLNIPGAYDLSGLMLIIYAIGSVVGIFAVCTVIDMLRIRFIERPFFSWIEMKPLFIKAKERFESAW